jgi:hypothetical protein
MPDEVPTLNQIQNFVGREKAKSGDSKPMTIHELQQFCTSNADESLDENSAYIIRHSIDSADRFIIVWSSTKLLNLQKQWKIICVDATYKILSYGYPILVCFLLLNFKNFFHLSHRGQASLMQMGNSTQP